jgi:hypothetical protein
LRRDTIGLIGWGDHYFPFNIHSSLARYVLN